MQQAAAAPTKRRRAWWGRRREPDAKGQFLDHLPLIERSATSVARRSGFSPEDVEDFVATVRVKLIDDDYGVIRRHRGSSKLSTYLVTVVHHAFQDWRNQKWGRFRPSAQAKRLGPTAVTLERLLVRDQLDLDAAIAAMGNHRGEASWAETSRAETSRDGKPSSDELRRLAAQLPVRLRRRMVSEDVLEDLPASPQQAADRRIEDGERTATAERVYSTLKRALVELEPREQMILEMFYAAGCSAGTIAKTLGVTPRRLYTSKDRCIRHLRRAFDGAGLTWDEVRDILGWVEVSTPPVFAAEGTSAGQQIGHPEGEMKP